MLADDVLVIDAPFAGNVMPESVLNNADLYVPCDLTHSAFLLLPWNGGDFDCVWLLHAVLW